MNLYTLAQIREQLWKYSPTPKTSYSSATTDQKAQFDDYLNQVCERLLGRMKPRFTMRRVNVPIYGEGYLTIPRELDNIDGIQLVDENNCACHPLQIYSRFHEWAHPVAQCCCNSAVFVLSDMVQTFLDPTPGDSGFYLRVVASEAGTISFKGGFDDNWDQLFTTTDLAFINGTATTTQAWMSLPQIIKPVTTGYIQLYAVDVDSGDATLIAVYAPGETIPAYKRYRIPDWNGYPLARVFGKLAFNKVVADGDIPFPQNSGALKAGLQALAFEDAADYQRSELLWASAQNILNEEQAETSDAEQPVFHVPTDFGAGNIIQVR